MDALGNVVNAVNAALRDTDRPWHLAFGWAEARTGVGRLKLFACLAFAVAAYMSQNGAGATLLGDAVGFAYPAYRTVALTFRGRNHVGGSGSAARRPPPPQTDGQPAAVGVHARWFTYWMTFAALLLTEQPLAALFRAVPLYCLVRAAFLVWCMVPVEANGSAYLYATVARRFSASRSAAAAKTAADDER